MGDIGRKHYKVEMYPSIIDFERDGDRKENDPDRAWTLHSFHTTPEYYNSLLRQAIRVDAAAWFVALWYWVAI